jgi:hypothetical protein
MRFNITGFIFIALFCFVIVGCFVSAECIKEGETGFIDLSRRPDNLSYNCCSGLYPASTSILTSEGLCASSVGSGSYKCTRAECSNNICEIGENICNCPQDCKTSSTSSIKVISPNGGEGWEMGGDYDIKWNSTNVDNVNIYLAFPDGALCFLKTTTASQGHYLFHFLGGYQCPNIDRVPHSQPNNNYKIAIFGNLQNVSDYSDNDFLIVYASVQPNITVISPNGGETWKIGETHDLIWNTTLYDPSGKIDLQLCDVRGVPGDVSGRYLCTEIITNLLVNSGSYSWTIPSQFLGGYPFNGSKVYRIEGRIWPEGLSRWAWIDLSDDNFSIGFAQGTQINTTVIQNETSTSQGTSQISIGKTSSGVISITQGNAEATSTSKLNVIDSKVYFETSSGIVKEVKVLPEEASSKSTIKTINEMKISEEDGKIIYSISGKNKGKFVFLIPVSASINQKINAENGEIISTEKPWWSFLASGI